MNSKILLIDIETCPNLAWVWGFYEQTVLAIEKEWHILSFSAKWFGGKSITKGLIDYPLYKKDKDNDKELVRDIWNLFNEADIIIAQNGDEFDIKKVNTRLIKHGFTPPAPYKTIDTLKISRKNFAFSSNRLDDIGEFLGIGRKIETTKKLWFDCMNGNARAWKLMKRYNKNDVILLEKAYLLLRPWHKQHPNLGIYETELVCPKCGSDNIHLRGFVRNTTSLYRRFQCQSCGGWGRSPISEKLDNKPLVNA